MPDIDPSRPPVSADELERDALATGADPDAPPLVEAQDPPGEGVDRVEEDLTLLPPG